MTPAVTTIVRFGAWTVIGALAGLGLITAGDAVVLPAAVAAGIGACVGSALAGGRSAKVALGLGAAWGMGVLVIAGLAVVAGPATVLVAPAVVAPLWWTSRSRLRKAAAPIAEPRPESTLAALSNVQLAREWHASYAALGMARDPTALELICALRRRQLDEIERRAPSGFHRWIASGGWVRGDSAPFLGG